MVARRKKAVAKKQGARRWKGMPPFRPTAEQRQQVELMAGLGMTQEEVAVVILNPRTGKGISDKTLREHFRQELATGRSKVKAKVAASLFKKATDDKHPQSAICGMFIMKCQFGWRQEDKLIHQVEPSMVGVLVAPAQRTPEEWIEEQRVKNLTRAAPGANGSGKREAEELLG